MTTDGLRAITAAGLLALGGGTQAAPVPYTVNGVDLVYDDVQDLTGYGTHACSSPSTTPTAWW
jgi:hypothetical protein